MKKKDDLREELEGLSPYLARIKQEKEGFKVPQYYFKALPNEVLEKLKQQAPAPERMPWPEKIALLLQGLWQPRYVLAVASGVALLVIALCHFNKNAPAQVAQPLASTLAAEIPYEDLHAYLTDNIEDIDEKLIAEASAPIASGESNPIILPQPTTEELEEYLDDVIDEIEPEDLEDLF